MSMMQVVLSNADHPEYGQATVPFPIPAAEYDDIIDTLRILDIGDPSERDCHVDEIRSYYNILKRLDGEKINLDEMDYLAKRLDSFCVGEDAQFQGMAAKLDISDMTDFINLTFCCQKATVITDFSDLEKIGKEHFLNLNGGCCQSAELEQLDGVEVACLLIADNPASVTPFGVVYDNGMTLQQVYDGQHFPEYWYGDTNLVVYMSSTTQKELQETCLQFPMPDSKVERVMVRAGIHTPEEITLRLSNSDMPEEVDTALTLEYESLRDLNRMTRAVQALDQNEQAKLAAVVLMANPLGARQVANLADSLDLFEFAPKARNAEEYGKYMIQKSGHFDFDHNLNAFYDYAAYGQMRLAEQEGQFNHRGYVSYQGTMPLRDLMIEGQPDSEFLMGGMA